MANKPISMSKLRQVLKLYCQGQNKLQVSTITGLSRNTVKKYIHVFIGLKTTWDEVNQLSNKSWISFSVRSQNLPLMIAYLHCTIF